MEESAWLPRSMRRSKVKSDFSTFTEDFVSKVISKFVVLTIILALGFVSHAGAYEFLQFKVIVVSDSQCIVTILSRTYYSFDDGLRAEIVRLPGVKSAEIVDRFHLRVTKEKSYSWQEIQTEVSSAVRKHSWPKKQGLM